MIHVEKVLADACEDVDGHREAQEDLKGQVGLLFKNCISGQKLALSLLNANYKRGEGKAFYRWVNEVQE